MNLDHKVAKHTSSSLHARPPPVEVAFLVLVIPYSRRSMVSDVGANVTGAVITATVGDMPTYCRVSVVSLSSVVESRAWRCVPRKEVMSIDLLLLRMGRTRCSRNRELFCSNWYCSNEIGPRVQQQLDCMITWCGNVGCE